MLNVAAESTADACHVEFEAAGKGHDNFVQIH